jgi:HlyD family secretion protein
MEAASTTTAANAASAKNAPAAKATTEDVQRTIGAGKVSVLRRVVVWATIIAVIAGGGVAFKRWRARVASRGPAFVAEPAKRADVQVTVTATGTLEAVTTVEVGAEVTGRVLKLTVDENDPVKKGQVLAVIDPEQLQAAVDQASAQVASADASILLAKATVTESTIALDRITRLRTDGLASQSDFDTATANKLRAQANLASAGASASLARAGLKQAKSRLDKSTIYSPIDGVVLARAVSLGQTVTAGFTTPVLFRLAQDLTLMRLKAGVDEADVGHVVAGADAWFTVEAYPGRKFTSKVVSLGNDPKTSQNVVTYQALLAVDNRELLLRPGMTCTATIVAETKKNALVVPNAALRFVPPAPTNGPPPEVKAITEADKRPKVWVLKDKTPVSLEVKIGSTDGIVTEILGGDVAPGTEVLTDVKEQP